MGCPEEIRNKVLGYKDIMMEMNFNKDKIKALNIIWGPDVFEEPKITIEKNSVEIKGGIVMFESCGQTFEMKADAKIVYKQKKAVVTGVTGQAASYLVELLLDKGYEVWGIYRRTTAPNFENLSKVIDDKDLHLVCGDITDNAFIFSCLSSIKPDEIYNLAAQSFVKASFDQPIHTFDVDTVGVLNFLEWIRQHSKETKFYQASTSEMFGKSASINYDCQGSDVRYDGPISEVKKTYEFHGYYCKPYQDEETPFIPQSPYAIAKLAAHHLCRLYREAYGLYVVSNITFNHESPRRGKEFVTRKITDYIGRLIQHKNNPVFDLEPILTYGDTLIPYDKQNNFPKLQLGNIYSSRDWGHARDYMEAAFSAMQQESGDDYVICTGETHTVEEFLEEAFSYVGLKWQDYVEISKEHMRPAEVDFLCGDSSKARRKLGWAPKTTFKELVKEMVESSIKEHSDGRNK